VIDEVSQYQVSFPTNKIREEDEFFEFKTPPSKPTEQAQGASEPA